MSKVAVSGVKCGGFTYEHGFTRAIFEATTAAAKRHDLENSNLNPRTNGTAIPLGAQSFTPQSHEKATQPAEACPILGAAKA
jgi:hypothetical protein